jgi:protein-S-isoprenylcysteine O-methyltransferase Ste14
MVAVNIRDGIRYGASLLGYFVVLFITGGIVSSLGFALLSLDNIVATLIGFLLFLAGLVVLYAGSLGVGYKVIADGVEQGVRSVRSDGSTDTSDTTGGGLIDSIADSVETTGTNRTDDQSRRE